MFAWDNWSDVREAFASWYRSRLADRPEPLQEGNHLEDCLDGHALSAWQWDEVTREMQWARMEGIPDDGPA